MAPACMMKYRPEPSSRIFRISSAGRNVTGCTFCWMSWMSRGGKSTSSASNDSMLASASSLMSPDLASALACVGRNLV